MFFFIFLLLSFGVSVSKGDGPPANKQIDSLMKIKESLDTNNTFLSSWTKTNNCSIWRGVECDNFTNEVVRINLKNVGLAGGSISKSFGNLTSLRALSLDSNNLVGSLPVELGDLINIVTIDLSFNYFSGQIPATLVNLSNLTELNLRNNLLSHPVPSILTNLINLEEIDLGNNLLNESVFDYSNLKKLKSLILDGNELEGSFPEIGNESSLEKLYLGFNRFNNSLPSYPSQLNITTDVRLDDNSICDLDTRKNITSEPMIKFLNKSCGCENINCPDDEELNIYLRRNFRTCNCSKPVTIDLLFSNLQFSVLTGEEFNIIKIRLVTTFNISLSQATFTTLNLTNNARQLKITISIFPQTLSFSNERRLEIENNFKSNPSLFSPEFGTFAIIGGLESSPSTEAPSPPPPISVMKSKSGGLKIWQILLICLGALILISTVSMILFFTYFRKVSDPPPDTKIENGEISAFKLKVQEHFVRAYTLKEIEIATDKFCLKNKIGSGSFGVVYKGVGSDKKQWAVKRGEHMTLETLQAFQTEVDVISKMSHRNLVRLLGFCSERNEQMLIYEYIPNGTLRQNLDRVKIGDSEPRAPLSFEERVDIAIGAAQGLHYLHSFAKPTIIHRDVKSANILLDAKMQPQIADFGLLKQMHNNPGVEDKSKIAGTPGYLDPEFSRAGKVTAKSDVYSFGVVLAELITGKPPVLDDPSPKEEDYKLTLAEWVLPLIKADEIESLVDPSLQGTYSDEAMLTLANVTGSCLQKNAKDRPDMAEVAWRLAEIRSKSMPSNDVQSFESLMQLSNLGRALRSDESSFESIASRMYSEMEIMRPPTAINGTGSYMLDEEALARADFYRPRRKDPLDFDSSSTSTQERTMSMSMAR